MDKGVILGVIQARMSSTRLPGKVLKEINGKPLLWYLYERITFSSLIERVVIATADTEACQPIIQFAQDNKIECYAGSENDLADRLYQTGKKYNGETIVMITGDCPLTDPEVNDKVIKYFMDNKEKYDFVSNAVKPTYPDGLDVSVMPFITLERVWKEVEDPFWREWIYSYIIEHHGSYRTGNVENSKDLSHLRWTVDYEEDFSLVTNIFNKLYPGKRDFTMKDILGLLDKEPWLTKINSSYVRNIAYHNSRKEANK
jgi:spore coat polysaccharide biosynthesis protein SpsF (cytidylyltransferase family)